MSDQPAAFEAELVGIRPLKTTPKVMLVFEIDRAVFEAQRVYEAMGGLPDPANPKRFGIARLADQNADPERGAKG